MKTILESAMRVGGVLCIVTTASLVVAVVALGSGGFLASDRIDAAVRGLRGETAAVLSTPVTAEAPAADRPAGELRELETLVTLAEARERDLRIQADRIRAEQRGAASRPAETTAVPAAGAAVAATTPAAAPTDARFRANVDVLRNHVPKTAAAMMADWETAEIVTYLRAMKPFEAADILGALLAMGRKGETDYARKAREVQAALGRQ